MKKDKHIRYCSYCGAKIKPKLVGAETVYITIAYTGTQFRYGFAYDRHTGKRQYVRQYTCPDSEKRWYKANYHDDYWVEEMVKKSN